jgi:hypothetical protein
MGLERHPVHARRIILLADRRGVGNEAIQTAFMVDVHGLAVDTLAALIHGGYATDDRSGAFARAVA